MSLHHIIKHIYHNATDEVIRRGKKIFHTSGVQITESDQLTETIIFRVRNDIYYNHYRVTIEKYGQAGKLSTRCQCPYNMGPVCRHEAAALFQLHDLLQSGYFDSVKIEYDQKHTNVRMRHITTHFLKLFSDQLIFDKAADLIAVNKVEIQEGKNDTVKAIVDIEGVTFPVVLKQNEERFFDTSCTCKEDKYPLCVHKVAVFLQLFHSHGSHYFSTIRDWDAQKNRLLALYGYSLKDDLKGKFEFSFHEGKLFLRVLDRTIKKIDIQHTREKEVPEVPANLRMGVVIRDKGTYFPYITFELISGTANDEETGFKSKIEKHDASQYIPSVGLQERDKILITAVRKQSPDELMKYLKRNSPFGEFWDSLPKELKTYPNEDLKKQVWEFYLPRYKNFLKQFSDYPFVYFLAEDKTLVAKHLTDLKLADDCFQTKITVHPENPGDGKSDIYLKLQLSLKGETYNPEDIQVLNSALVKLGNHLYAADTLETVSILELFDHQDVKKIPADAWPSFLESTVLPLSGATAVEFHPSLVIHKDEEEPELRLHLKETEKSMIFKPLFVYGEIIKEWLDFEPIRIARDGKIIIQKRDEAAEQYFLTLLRHLHPSMQESRKAASFWLSGREALQGNWYFEFLDILKSQNINVIGYENLKQLKVNPNKPLTKLQINSGIDWFDTTIDVSFGEENVDITAIKKAMLKKQNFVSLRDGSIGLLPQDWMDKYALMIKLGTTAGNNKLRLKKFHFSALENLKEEISEAEVLEHLSEKRDRLGNFNFDRQLDIPVPENVQATLRPYQQAGFQWMTFLKETGWGGILADDMGLGKTLQALTILQHYLNLYPNALFLVACPTTLIYNWENEIKRYTPEITYLIHHGPQRTSSIKRLGEKNLIITTYGTLRSDIKTLSELSFDYVVLDESQTIKNPLSQVARASLLLKSKNRIALSGTPVQNNTFDLFAQMNFLNPGMLGTMEFFRNEFANPIDKNQEKEAKENLRKLINPFLLRRTKEQVAPDLPEKTEIVYYCEMGAKQRKIYETFKNSFRSKILGEIEEKGLARTRLSVLTGLMKLRQICDSPAILNDDEKFENHSIKIQELVRSLTENAGEHKALVFSQFLGMLQLIREELEKLHIPYVYFDGSTTSTEREKAINDFQNNKETRVFLISLKAGGVGLNLTAADYVYIVDPWWNPAVEQQAIDRTHRIGQTKNIFAYRLICKDTIEEKILLLQERKLSLVKDLVSEENAFLKKLTKEDIDYLLS